MKHSYSLLLIVFILFFVYSLLQSGNHEYHKSEEPAHLIPLEKDGEYKIVLEPKAAERTGIEVVTGQSSTIPHEALFYDIDGGTWMYTNPEPFTYKKERVTVQRIDAGVVYLSENVDPQDKIVTKGIMELYGVETGVGGGH